VVRKVNVPLVRPGPLKPMLFVVKPPQGSESDQRAVPQSITPVGYWPFSSTFWPVRSSKVTVDVVIGVPLKFAVSVEFAVPVLMLCCCAPPSDQEAKVYCVEPWICGDGAKIVRTEFGIVVIVAGPAYGSPL
jgi:hypothetical protein